MIEAIKKLLEERPGIDGIALPGIPSGSPGMPGPKRAPFTIYQILDGQYSEFMTVRVEKTLGEDRAEKTVTEEATEKKRVEFVSPKEAIIEELIAQDKYSCCLENPCTPMASPPLSSILEKLKFWGPIAENCKIRKER